MQNSYQDPKIGKAYLDFINSTDGQIQQAAILKETLAHLPNKPVKILDAGCGTGWLANKIQGYGHTVKACDLSEELIEYAQKNFPAINFAVCNLENQVPFMGENFDFIVASLALHDIPNINLAVKNLSQCLKPKGEFLLLTLNPYFAYPVGEWKRGLAGRLLGKKPKLVLNSYNQKKKAPRQFTWRGGIPGYFYTLPEIFNAFLKQGFLLKSFRELEPQQNSDSYDLNYRLERFPVFVSLLFEKNP